VLGGGVKPTPIAKAILRNRCSEVRTNASLVLDRTSPLPLLSQCCSDLGTMVPRRICGHRACRKGRWGVRDLGMVRGMRQKSRHGDQRLIADRSEYLALEADEPTTGEGSEPYRLLHTAEVLRILGVSRTGLYLWRKAGIFPPARRLGANSIGWLLSDIKAFLDSRPRTQ
jgi:prophage regulatory protein